MDIHKEFEEAILRAKDQPNLTSENQAQLFGLHQQATTGDYTGSDARATDPNHLNAWEKYRGLSMEEAKKLFIKYVSELTKRQLES